MTFQTFMENRFTWHGRGEYFDSQNKLWEESADYPSPNWKPHSGKGL